MVRFQFCLKSNILLTFTSSNVINYAFSRKSKNDQICLFFLEQANAASLKAETVIKSILRQSMDCMVVTADIENLLQRLLERLFVKLEDWIHLLQLTVQKSDSVFIFLDGLDECDAIERRRLLKALSIVSDNLPAKIFISSRDSVSIDLQPKFPRFEHVSMTDHITPDIKSYIDAVLNERIQNEDLIFGDNSLLLAIKETLTNHADGM